MQLHQYQASALQTAKVFPDLTGNLSHAAIGIQTESGEIVSTLKRFIIYRSGLSPEMKQNLVEEIGDFMWYVALFAKYVGYLPDALPQVDLEAIRLRLIDDDEDTPSIYKQLCATLATASAQAWDFSYTLDGRLPRTVVDTCLASAVTLAHLFDLDMQVILDQNLFKLQKKRYPQGYSDAAAEARADKGGLDRTQS